MSALIIVVTGGVVGPESSAKAKSPTSVGGRQPVVVAVEDDEVGHDAEAAQGPQSRPGAAHP